MKSHPLLTPSDALDSKYILLTISITINIVFMISLALYWPTLDEHAEIEHKIAGISGAETRIFRRLEVFNDGLQKWFEQHGSVIQGNSEAFANLRQEVEELKIDIEKVSSYVDSTTTTSEVKIGSAIPLRAPSKTKPKAVQSRQTIKNLRSGTSKPRYKRTRSRDGKTVYRKLD